MIHTQAYDVDIKHIQVDVEADTKRAYNEDGQIIARQTVSVKEVTDIKDAPEKAPEGAIKPYGLDVDGAYDVEVKEKIGDPLIQNQIDTNIENAITETAPRKAKHDIYD